MIFVGVFGKTYIFSLTLDVAVSDEVGPLGHVHAPHQHRTWLKVCDSHAACSCRLCGETRALVPLPLSPRNIAVFIDQELKFGYAIKILKYIEYYI